MLPKFEKLLCVHTKRNIYGRFRSLCNTYKTLSKIKELNKIANAAKQDFLVRTNIFAV